MSKVNMTEDEFDAQLNESYKVGESVGLKAAASELLQRATMYFTTKQDEKAKLLREIAEELTRKGNNAHPRQEPTR